MSHHKNVQFIFIYDGKWKASTLWSWWLPYFSFLERDIFMFPPVPFLELEVRNTSKTREAWTEVIKTSGWPEGWGWFSLRSWNNTCPLPEQPGVRGQWLNWAEKTPQLWLSLDQHSFLERLCTKKSRKQVVLTQINVTGRLCRRSSWALMEKTCHVVLPKGALAENSLK